ncbi:MAG: electron transfer flavoprotein subunit beta/FixA family protein [Phycisphaerae bacterium]|nr:electron transfer flavoprotein subunit beta/FixA family protein [Phycisphaerae bacterium]
MRIIVPIKQVPETNAVKMDGETGTMIREGVEAIVNPLDLYAIETAIRLKEAHGGEIIVISMGPPKAVSAIREAIAMGCDSGILLTDKAFAGSDTWATSYVLSAAVRQIGEADLIICGERATDGDTGQVGPGLAAFLDLPVATYVSRIDSVSADSCRVHRMVENGYEVLDVETPAVLTVIKEIAAPRLPTLRGKLRAKHTEIPAWSPGNLDVEACNLGLDGSRTRVVKISRPKVGRQCEKIVARDEESLSEAADKLVMFLQERDLIKE